MAIDPNIAMSFQPAQIQSPLQLAGQTMALRNAGLQQQMGQQQLEQGQMSLKQAGQTWQDEQADRAAVRNNMQADPQTGQVKLNRAGYLNDLSQAAPTLAMQRAQEFATQDFMRSQQQAALTKTQLENAKAHTDMVGQMLQGIVSQPTPEAKQTAYSNARMQMIQNGVLHPGGPDDPGESYPGDDIIQRQLAQTVTQKDAIAAQQKQLEMNETARHNTATEATGQQTAAAAGVRAQAAATDARNNTVRTGIEQGRFKLEQQYMPAAGAGLTGDAYLQTLNPAVQPQIKSIAQGDIKMPPARSVAGMNMRNAVLQYDPTFTDSRYDTKQNFKTKGDAQNIVQLATAMEHADNARQHSANVGWAPFLSQNATPADAAYNKDIQYLTGEVGKLVKNQVVGEKEADQLQTGLNSSRQSIRDAALNETMKLLGGKVGGVFQKYKAGTGQDLPVQTFFDAPTQQRLQKFGVVQAPAAGSSTPAAAAAAPVQAAPSTHIFSIGAWQRANPQGDARAAQAQAVQQGFQVVQ